MALIDTVTRYRFDIDTLVILVKVQNLAAAYYS